MNNKNTFPIIEKEKSVFKNKLQAVNILILLGIVAGYGNISTADRQNVVNKNAGRNKNNISMAAPRNVADKKTKENEKYTTISIICRDSNGAEYRQEKKFDRVLSGQAQKDVIKEMNKEALQADPSLKYVGSEVKVHDSDAAHGQYFSISSYASQSNWTHPTAGKTPAELAEMKKKQAEIERIGKEIAALEAANKPYKDKIYKVNQEIDQFIKAQQKKHQALQKTVDINIKKINELLDKKYELLGGSGRRFFNIPGGISEIVFDFSPMSFKSEKMDPPSKSSWWPSNWF